MKEKINERLEEIEKLSFQYLDKTDDINYYDKWNYYYELVKELRIEKNTLKWVLDLLDESEIEKYNNSEIHDDFEEK